MERKNEAPSRVVVTDFDMGIASIIRLAFKILIAQFIVWFVAGSVGTFAFLFLAAIGAAMK